jgi:uncharacterized membrane protein YfcA
LAGAIIGCLVTITSIGAGAIGAVALIYLYPLRLTPPKIVGTDLAHAIPLALLAGAGHVTMGNFDYSLLIKLLAGSIPGVIFGTLACGIFSPIIVRHCIAVALMAAGFRLLSFAQ